jgi:hypothetical protein
LSTPLLANLIDRRRNEVSVPSFAMKVYDLQWFTTFGLDYDQAAEALVEDCIDTVLTQNRIDPLPHSGVDQTAYLSAYRERLASYDDAAWLAALRTHGLRVLQTTSTLFDPAALARFPDARPVNARGEPDAGLDWYIGICPTHSEYLDWKIALLKKVARELRPDGLFLQFLRYPGFWENWTWNPDYAFSDADRFCFCHRCRALFSRSQNIDLPAGSIATQAAAILSRHREEWNRWRSQRIVEIVERIKLNVAEGGKHLTIMLNTLPFPRSDFDGLNVRYEFAAQNLPTLASTVDRFELMTYLQILNRPVSWLRTVIDAARDELPTGKEVVCTLQVSPLYASGIHATRRRSTSLTDGDLDTAARTALNSGADGIVFYHWTDFLNDEAEGGRKRLVLRSLTRG